MAPYFFIHLWNFIRIFFHNKYGRVKTFGRIKMAMLQIVCRDCGMEKTAKEWRLIYVQSERQK